MRDVLKDWITRESVLLVVLVAVAGALWGFLELQDEVVEGELRAVDESILLFFRQPNDPDTLRGLPGLEKTARDITSLGGPAVLVLISLGVAGFFALRREWVPLLAMIATVLGGLALVEILKPLYARDRPEVTEHLMEEVSYSFPSGHSTMAAVVYLTLAVMLAEFFEKRRLRVYVLAYAGLLVVLIGCSRVILGVHYPTDVTAGWTLGFFWAALSWLVARVVKRWRRAKAADSEEA